MVKPRAAFARPQRKTLERPIGNRGLIGLYPFHSSLGLVSSDFGVAETLAQSSEGANMCTTVDERMKDPSSETLTPLSLFLAGISTVSGQEMGDFSPVLNVPALSSFSVIFCIFVLLQLRVRSIGRAADERTKALEELRRTKANELGGDASTADVERALENYRRTYERVEDLRTVVPGLARIVPPPSQSMTRERMNDNDAAARQFLGVESDVPAQNNDENEEKSLPLPLALLLAVVAISQIGVLLLLSVDPITSNNAFNAISDVSGI